MSDNGTQSKDYLGMSDEDFLKTSAPVSDSTSGQQEAAGSGAVGSEGTQTTTPAAEATTASAETEVATTTTTATEAAQGVNADEEDEASDTAANKEDDKTEVADQGKDKTSPAGKPTTDEADKTKAAPAPGSSEAEADKTKPAAAETQTVDYEGFFKEVMKPFKANGREIKLNTPEEAIRLMQMGAGYGRKLQDLQPALKTLRMLEKADLLDEGKLSFLIDINNKNPEAIKKLIADSGIDPLELNIGDNVSYTPTNHSVSDKEMAFRDVLTTVQSATGGKETIEEVNRTWDQESKAALWDNPQLLGIIQSQRETGVYAQITAEIDRQKLLGLMSTTTPFLQAYKQAGDRLFPQPQIQTQPGTQSPQPQVIATRPAAPKAQVENGSKAAAAAPTKTASQRNASTTVNPLEMADDEFMSKFKGRL